MGEFILLAARNQAARQGVTAEEIIRERHVVGDEIVSLCQEVGADYVVLGRPREAAEENIFTHEQLDQFGLYIERETGAKVICPGGSEQ